MTLPSTAAHNIVSDNLVVIPMKTVIQKETGCQRLSRTPPDPGFAGMTEEGWTPIFDELYEVFLLADEKGFV